MQVPPGNALPAVLGLTVDMKLIRPCIQPACRGNAVDNTSMRDGHPVRQVQTCAAANYPFSKDCLCSCLSFCKFFSFCLMKPMFCWRDVKTHSLSAMVHKRDQCVHNELHASFGFRDSLLAEHSQQHYVLTDPCKRQKPSPGELCPSPGLGFCRLHMLKNRLHLMLKLSSVVLTVGFHAVHLQTCHQSVMPCSKYKLTGKLRIPAVNQSGVYLPDCCNGCPAGTDNVELAIQH